MNKQTILAETIDTADDRAKYDACAKKLVSEKVILAWILKHCAQEFEPYSIDYIMDHCIEGNAKISLESVHQDIGASRIQGMNTEDMSIQEGTVYYDIRFSACPV